MTTIYVLTVGGGRGYDEPAITLHTTRADAEAALRDNFDQEPSDFDDLIGDDLIEALANRDELDISISAHELPNSPLVVSFEPAAIREHFAPELEDRHDGNGPDVLEGLTDADLEEVGATAMLQDMVWEAFDIVLREALVQHGLTSGGNK